MAERFNQIYLDERTRFETRGRSTSAIQHSQKIDQIASKYAHKMNHDHTSKRHNLDLVANLDGDRLQRITRIEKEAMARSMDKFLHKAPQQYQNKKVADIDYINDPLLGIAKRGTPNFNAQNYLDYKGLENYDRLTKFQNTGKYEKTDFNVRNTYTNNSGIPNYSQNIDLLRGQLQMKPKTSSELGLLNKYLPEGLNSFKNERALDANFGLSRQNQYYDRKNLLNQLSENPRAESDLLGRGFGREINRQFGKQSNGGYLKDLQKAYNLNYGKDYLKKQVGANYQRFSPSKAMSKEYLKDYSALNMRDEIAKMKTIDVGKSISRDYGKSIDHLKLNRYDRQQGNVYGQNLYHDSVSSKRDLLAYRGSKGAY